MKQGKRIIINFIYDGLMDWYVRIPYGNNGGVWNSRTYVYKYFPKSEHTFQDAIDWRLMMMKKLEAEGKRGNVDKIKGRWHTAKKFEEEEKAGMYKEFLQ